MGRVESHAAAKRARHGEQQNGTVGPASDNTNNDTAAHCTPSCTQWRGQLGDRGGGWQRAESRTGRSEIMRSESRKMPHGHMLSHRTDMDQTRTFDAGCRFITICGAVSCNLACSDRKCVKNSKRKESASSSALCSVLCPKQRPAIPSQRHRRALPSPRWLSLSGCVEAG